MNGNSLKSFLFSNMERELTDRNNYRPISILPILSQILKRAVHNQLLDHLKKYYILKNCQYSYCNNRSTELASTSLLDNIRKNADFGSLVGTVFIDLRRRSILLDIKYYCETYLHMVYVILN